jgi:gamma-butyrobetaine dioxygenase
MVTFTLAPGDCVIFDNTRLLHARTAFASAGARHLQGCYADIDALQSIVEV